MKHWPFQTREKRFDVAASTVIESATGYCGPARILNVSNHGCRIATRKSLEIGEDVRLNVEPFGYVGAKVVWTCFEGAGLKIVCRFTNCAATTGQDEPRLG